MILLTSSVFLVSHSCVKLRIVCTKIPSTKDTVVLLPTFIFIVVFLNQTWIPAPPLDIMAPISLGVFHLFISKKLNLPRLLSWRYHRLLIPLNDVFMLHLFDHLRWWSRRCIEVVMPHSLSNHIAHFYLAHLALVIQVHRVGVDLLKEWVFEVDGHCVLLPTASPKLRLFFCVKGWGSQDPTLLILFNVSLTWLQRVDRLL